MLWTKQYYYFDVDRWLEEHGADPLYPNQTTQIRNRDWFHMVNDDVISMPDKWEYPWYAAWDLAFHASRSRWSTSTSPSSSSTLMLRELYLHPERPDAGVRVELRRREPAGPRLGDDLPLPEREVADGDGRRRAS